MYIFPYIGDDLWVLKWITRALTVDQIKPIRVCYQLTIFELIQQISEILKYIHVSAIESYIFICIHLSEYIFRENNIFLLFCSLDISSQSNPNLLKVLNLYVLNEFYKLGIPNFCREFSKINFKYNIKYIIGLNHLHFYHI